MTSHMIGLALMALMIMLVIGGGTTWVYLAGQRDAFGPAEAPTETPALREEPRPSASHTVD
jgi:hypothetical protein